MSTLKILTWVITAIAATGGVISFVLNYDITAGTAIAQDLANTLANAGYAVTVVSPEGTPKIFAAPEIDAASGTSAIALLTGVLLLVGERSRSRRS